MRRQAISLLLLTTQAAALATTTPTRQQRLAYFAARTREDAARAAKRALFGDALSNLPPAGPRGVEKGAKILVTGATGGVGLEIAKELARDGYGVVLCGRSEGKAAAAAKTVKRRAKSAVSTQVFDLESLTATRAAAAALKKEHPDLKGLVLNAGCWPTTLRLTEDELEAGLQANHLSHFLLATELLEELPLERVVAVSSSAHASTKRDAIDLEDTLWTERAFDPLEAYSATKLANALFARELPKRFPGTLAVSAHPGVIGTDLFREFDALSLAPRPPDPFGLLPDLDGRAAEALEGAAGALQSLISTAPVTPFKTARAAARDVLVGLLAAGLAPGTYLSDGEATEASPGARDDEAAAELWDWSADVVREALAAADEEGGF